MAVDLRPSRVDPLFAADTPITPDPTPGAKGSSKGYATREAMIARLVAAGYTAEEAAKVVDAELARSGPRPEGMWAQDNSPAGMANLRQGIANQRASERRMGAFEDNYNAATGAPAKPEIAPPPTAPDEVPLTADELRGMGYNPYTEPGVNMPDGTKAARPRQLMTESEAAAYNTRTPNGPGWYNPSGRDKDMMARGYVPVMNQDGTVSYRLGPGGEVDGLPGTPGRGGRREDLEAPLMKADGTPVLDGNGNPVPRFRVDNMSGPLSENNSVYVQSNEARAKQDAYRRERQLYRDAEIQGVSPAQLLAQSPGDYGDLTAGGQRDRIGARAANEGARQAAAAKREEAWRAQMMLGGGRPTGGIGGSKATVNAWLNLPPDQRASAMRYMLPGGQLSATVDAANATQAGRMAQQAMVAFLQNNPGATPEQRAAAEIQLRKGDPAAAGAADIAAGKFGSPEALDEFDRLAGANDTTWAGFSYEDERRMAATLQKPPYNMSQAEAEAKAYEYAEKRRWVSGGGPGGAKPAAPGAAPGTPAPPPSSDPRAWGGGA